MTSLPIIWYVMYMNTKNFNLLISNQLMQSEMHGVGEVCNVGVISLQQ